MALPEEFKYLPWLVAVMLTEFVGFACLVRYYHRKTVLQVLASRGHDEGMYAGSLCIVVPMEWLFTPFMSSSCGTLTLLSLLPFSPLPSSL